MKPTVGAALIAAVSLMSGLGGGAGAPRPPPRIPRPARPAAGAAGAAAAAGGGGAGSAGNKAGRSTSVDQRNNSIVIGAAAAAAPIPLARSLNTRSSADNRHTPSKEHIATAVAVRPARTARLPIVIVACAFGAAQPLDQLFQFLV